MTEPDPLAFLAAERGSRQPAGPGWSTSLGLGLIVAALVGTVMFATAPAPYVIETPGPVYDTLGSVETADGDQVALIDIPDEQTYPTSGRLDLLTVYLDGSPQDQLAWLDVVKAWFDPSAAVLPVETVYPEGQSEEESDEESALAMDTSQQDAVAAALTRLGIGYEVVFAIVGVIEGMPADGTLQEGDQIVSANGVGVADVEALRQQVQAVGVGGELDLVVLRDGVKTTATLSPVDSEGTPVIGVYAGSTYDFPIDVDFLLENVGGPSAGMMFALAVYDKLTPGQLTGGEHIAGTGTISGAGDVGAIGGIVQKMYGADAAGADWFLAPESNCSEVLGRVPGDLRVVAVSTLEDAIAALDGIAAGNTDDLPTCGD